VVCVAVKVTVVIMQHAPERVVEVIVIVVVCVVQQDADVVWTMDVTCLVVVTVTVCETVVVFLTVLVTAKAP
jgi:hypothetical protein